MYKCKFSMMLIIIVFVKQKRARQEGQESSLVDEEADEAEGRKGIHLSVKLIEK